MNNWTKNSSGKNIRSFIRKCPNYVIKHLSLKETRKDEFTGMFKKWAKNKEIEDYLKLNEYKALERIFDVKDENVRTVSIYINNLFGGIYHLWNFISQLRYFAFCQSRYNVSSCISDILNWEEAKILDMQGANISIGTRFGDTGIRKSKEKYSRAFFLRNLPSARKLTYE